MPDAHLALRVIPFTVLAGACGIDLARFKRVKDEYVGPCPYHNPKQNMGCFRYHDTGLFNCFVCMKTFSGKGALDFVMKLKQINFTSAVSFLEGLEVPPVPENPAREETKATATYSSEDDVPAFNSTYQKFAKDCEWLKVRIPNNEVLQRYGVFYYSNPQRKSKVEGTVLLPIRNSKSGQCVGYLSRAIHDGAEMKYRFPANLPKSLFLFGAHELSSFGQLPLRYVYLLESPFAVLKFASLGLPAVSPFGWSISTQQVQLLQSVTKGIVYLPDRNKYGECAQVVHALCSRLWTRCPPLPAGIEDPESLTLEQIQALTR